MPYAQAVAIEDGRILAVDSNERVRALIGPKTRIIDVGGRLVTPGLIEAHVHLGNELPTPPLAMPNLPFPGPTGEQDFWLRWNRRPKRAPTGSVPISVRWSRVTSATGARRWMWWRRTRRYSSRVFGDTPVSSTAKGCAGSASPKASPIPLGGWWGRDENGRLDGRAYEAAETITPRIRPLTPEHLATVFGAAQQRYARWGVTSIHLMNNDKSLEVTLAGLAIAKPLQKWTVYSWGAYETRQRIPDAWTVIDSVAKQTVPRCVSKGRNGCWTARRSNRILFSARPTSAPGWRGRSNLTDEQLREILKLALTRSTQLALHVVGDAETDRLLKMMEQLAPASAWRAKRVRIEHGDGIRTDDRESRAARSRRNPKPDPPRHCRCPVKMLDHEHMLLKSFIAAGIPLALGSDGGVKEQNPFLNLMLAMLVPGEPSEALSREPALTAYTTGGAYAEGQEKRKGRIAPGLAADLAVLSQDVLTIPTPQLPATTSLLTMVDGEVIFEDALWTSRP